ncbi:MAG: hypothetical protein IIA59_00220 [Candidatus Marinimicrobia bacterium]|nr:hypothetical protein [Candidatus Neomarinimicrobiota bacterium]
MPHHDSLTRPRRLHRTTVAALLALVLATGCDNASILSPLPGSQWQLSDTTLSAMSFRQIEVSAFSNGSRTLYAGPIGGDPAKESVILLRPALFDSLHIADSNFVSAELVIFRRVFRDSTRDLSSLFELSVIVADSSVWSAADTGLTVDSPGLQLRTGVVEASMTTASVTVPLGDSTETLVGIEHITFPILAETFDNWLNDTTALNGFMLRQVGGLDAVAFHARLTTRPPFVALTYTDTAEGGDLTTVYSGLVADLGIYPPSQEPAPTDSTLMVFNYYNGWGAHVNFSPSLKPDSSRLIVAAKLKFYSPQLPDDLIASTVTLRLDRVIDDSLKTEVLFTGVNYASDETEWTVIIGRLADEINSGRSENFGIDIRVVPSNHDFDTLIFYSPYADAAVQPTLELVYAVPYAGRP